MITDDTILEQLDWEKYDNNKSYNVAAEKYNKILSYVFPGINTTTSIRRIDGIEIESWDTDTHVRGIKLNFWHTFERRSRFCCVAFEGIAKDFKAKVLEKFEALKSLKRDADIQTELRKDREIADKLEITRLTQIAKQAFDKYEVKVSKNSHTEGYTLTLEIDFNNKTELLIELLRSVCDPKE